MRLHRSGPKGNKVGKQVGSQVVLASDRDDAKAEQRIIRDRVGAGIMRIV